MMKSLLRFVLAVVAFTQKALRRMLKRVGRPGSGPFFAGC